MWTGLYVTLARTLIHLVLLYFVWKGSRVALIAVLMSHTVSLELLTAGARFLSDVLWPTSAQRDEAS
jgi:hypothetical protein